MANGGAAGAGAAGAAAAAAIANAIKASGVLVRLDPEEFAKLLARAEAPLVVAAEGFWGGYKYLTSYRGLAFFTVVIVITLGGGPLWLLYLAMAMFGLGFFTTAPLAAGLVGDLFGNLRMGTIMGIIMASHIVGVAIGGFAGGLTFELTGSYYTFFFVQGGLELLAAVCAFAIRRQSVRS